MFNCLQRFFAFSAFVKNAILNWFLFFLMVIFQTSGVNLFMFPHFYMVSSTSVTFPHILRIRARFCNVGWNTIMAISSAFVSGVIFKLVFPLTKLLCKVLMPQPLNFSWTAMRTCLLHRCQCKVLIVPCPEDFMVISRDILCKWSC